MSNLIYILLRPALWGCGAAFTRRLRARAQSGPLTLLAFSALLLAPFAWADSIDRLALIVGKTAFTQSEVDDEVRLTEFEAGKPLDLSAAKRKEAAERLVDQELLREEIAATAFQTPSVDAAALLRRFRQEHYSSTAQYRAALAAYGISEELLQQHLAWEVELLQFTNQRFKAVPPAPDSQSANRSDGSAQPAAADAADHQMDDWLKQQRAATRIIFKDEAFK